MPLELIADRPGHAVFRSYREPPLAPDAIRVQSLFSSVKHGTELRGFRADTPDASDRYWPVSGRAGSFKATILHCQRVLWRKGGDGQVLLAEQQDRVQVARSLRRPS